MTKKPSTSSRVTEDGEVILADNMLNNEYPVFFKTPWNHNRDTESLTSALECTDATKCQRHLAAEADINNILRKFLSGGDLPITGPAQYLNIEELADLQDVIVTRSQVDEAWNQLPGAVRNMLRDPKTFADYVQHCLETGDIDPLRELGLAKPKPPEPAITPGGALSNPPPPAEAPSASKTAPSGASTDSGKG